MVILMCVCLGREGGSMTLIWTWRSWLNSFLLVADMELWGGEWGSLLSQWGVMSSALFREAFWLFLISSLLWSYLNGSFQGNDLPLMQHDTHPFQVRRACIMQSDKFSSHHLQHTHPHLGLFTFGGVKIQNLKVTLGWRVSLNLVQN